MSVNLYSYGGLYNYDIGGIEDTPIPPAIPGFWELQETPGLFELEGSTGLFQLEQVISAKNKIRVTVRLK